MNINFDPARKPGVVAQLLTMIGGLLALAAAFMFSLVFFAVLAIAVLIFGVYFWWKTRALRRQMREHLDQQRSSQDFGPAASAPDETGSVGEIIEGEAVRVVNEQHRLGE